MAERRMFAKTIVLSDAFLDMPLGARCLYMTMGMLADDDGFVNNPKSIIRQCGASDDDMRILFAKKFVIPFDNGVVVIKHWRINNYLRNDRYQETKYIEQKEQLELDENNAYKAKEGALGIPSTVYPVQDRLGKDSIGNNSVGAKTKRFAPPTQEELDAYCEKKGYTFNTKRFISYYESNGWKVGRNKMRSWRATADRWAMGTEKEQPKPKGYNSDWQTVNETTETQEERDERERRIRERLLSI